MEKRLLQMAVAASISVVSSTITTCRLLWKHDRMEDRLIEMDGKLHTERCHNKSLREENERLRAKLNEYENK